MTVKHNYKYFMYCIQVMFSAQCYACSDTIMQLADRCTKHYLAQAHYIEKKKQTTKFSLCAWELGYKF